MRDLKPMQDKLIEFAKKLGVSEEVLAGMISDFSKKEEIKEENPEMKVEVKVAPSEENGEKKEITGENKIPEIPTDEQLEKMEKEELIGLIKMFNPHDSGREQGREDEGKMCDGFKHNPLVAMLKSKHY